MLEEIAQQNELGMDDNVEQQAAALEAIKKQQLNKVTSQAQITLPPADNFPPSLQDHTHHQEAG